MYKDLAKYCEIGQCPFLCVMEHWRFKEANNYFSYILEMDGQILTPEIITNGPLYVLHKAGTKLRIYGGRKRNVDMEYCYFYPAPVIMIDQMRCLKI